MVTPKRYTYILTPWTWIMTFFGNGVFAEVTELEVLR